MNNQLQNAIKLGDNLYCKYFDELGLVEEFLGMFETCYSCNHFRWAMGEMGICKNKTGCACSRTTDMWNPKCSNGTKFQIIYSGKSSEYNIENPNKEFIVVFKEII